jgi:hypothetical protein
LKYNLQPVSTWMLNQYERPRVKYYFVNRPTNQIRTTKRVRRINRWSRQLPLDPITVNDDLQKMEEQVPQQKTEESFIQDPTGKVKSEGKKKDDGVANSLLATAATVAGAQVAGQAFGRPPALITPGYGFYPGLQTHPTIYPNIQGTNYGSNYGFSSYQNPYLGYSPYQGSNFAVYPNPVFVQPDFARPRPHHHHRDRQSGKQQFVSMFSFSNF